EDGLLDQQHEVNFRCFQAEIEAAVFASLSDRQGCQFLMQEIRQKPGFLPAATWLVACADGYCGTVQGVRERHMWGSIQNLGVTTAHRGRGIGSALLLQALHGFRSSGLGRALLEVTAQNDAAVRLYRRLGFRCRKTIYKEVHQGTESLPALVPGATSW